MIIGIPKEIKDNEYRVAIVPAGVKELTACGHKVLIEKNAGTGSGIGDAEYRQAGALLIDERGEIFDQADLIVKVKEPLYEEFPLFRSGQILFTYLHLAANIPVAEALLSKNVVAIGYETIRLSDNSLPLLKPMSEIAGKLAVQIGAHYLEKNSGGRGVLLGGVPGIPKGEVTILGGGTVGMNAAKIALGMGAHVHIVDRNPKCLSYLDDIFQGRATTLYSNNHNIEEAVLNSDLLIGAVLLPGGQKAPHLVNKELVAQMRKGAVIVDVAIDQGGCIETSKPTTHSNPIFTWEGIIHYCVCNIPGIVARSSTLALTNLTLPYIVKIADSGLKEAVQSDPSLAAGVNIYRDKVTCSGVAEVLQLPCHPILHLI
ncbi:MAG: alanine dehydrogenase [Candidatus Schekmanbacteria bacterium]|nr:alanine dehydrogenase [Candidatus Schekmanbacteria bacterium]